MRTRPRVRNKCLMGGTEKVAALDVWVPERVILKNKTIALSDLLAVYRAFGKQCRNRLENTNSPGSMPEGRVQSPRGVGGRHPAIQATLRYEATQVVTPDTPTTATPWALIRLLRNRVTNQLRSRRATAMAFISARRNSGSISRSAAGPEVGLGPEEMAGSHVARPRSGTFRPRL